MSKPSEVYFNASDREHQKAFVSLVLFNRQHPTLRFKLETPHASVRDMLMFKMCEVHAASVPNLIAETTAMFEPRGGVVA